MLLSNIITATLLGLATAAPLSNGIRDPAKSTTKVSERSVFDGETFRPAITKADMDTKVRRSLTTTTEEDKGTGPDPLTGSDDHTLPDARARRTRSVSTYFINSQSDSKVNLKHSSGHSPDHLPESVDEPISTVKRAVPTLPDARKRAD